MSPVTQAILWMLAVAGVIGCGLFAGLETGVYSLNRVRLHVRAHRSRRAAILDDLVTHPARLLASLLIATNVATNIATSSLAAALHGYGMSDWQVIACDVLIMTPIFFIFAETLPKDLFSAHSDLLVYPFARLLRVLTFVCHWLGLLALLIGVSRLVMWMIGAADAQPFGRRMLMGTLLKEGVGRGVLSDDQSAIVERVLALGEQTVGEVMLDWSNVTKLDGGATAQHLWDLADQTSRSRFPVVDEGGAVRGCIDIHDALVFDPPDCPPVESLMRPARAIEIDTPIRQALQMLQTGVPMAVVVRQDRPVGIVTLKDLLEPITGELASW
ncbi:MAG: hypothetical protein CMJ18_23215 [Phycisphaeraceae bacterium]|nr:hypothetical protein [Phycisphaeraceae bacterium]